MKFPPLVNTRHRFVGRATWAILALAFSHFAAVSTPALEIIESKEGTGLGFGTRGYLSPYLPSQKQTGTNIFTFFVLERVGSNVGDWSESRFNAKGYFPTRDARYFAINPKEIYFGTSPKLMEIRLGAGTRLETWNIADEEWSLGVWQPRFRADPLHPDRVGLPGVHFRYDEGPVAGAITASPIFIPEMGMPYKLENGVFTSPWGDYVAPSPSVQFSGVPTRVRYDLQVPNIAEFIYKPNFSTTVRLGEKTGPFGRLSYAYLPINQVLVAYQGEFRVPANDVGQVNVKLAPRVLYHQLAGADVGYEDERLRLSVSGLAERPESDTPRPGWTIQQVSQHFIVSPSLHWVALGHPDDGLRLSSSFLRRWGDDAPDLGPLSNGEGSVFEPRIPYETALRAGIDSPLFGKWGRKVRIRSQWTYEFASLSTMLLSEISMPIIENLTVTLGADFLGTRRENKVDDLISQYRSSSRVLGSLTYVF